MREAVYRILFDEFLIIFLISPGFRMVSIIGNDQERIIQYFSIGSGHFEIDRNSLGMI